MLKMRNSRVDWIGEIPSAWHISKLKYLGEYINGFAFKPEDWGTTGKPIIRIQDLTKSSDNTNYFDGTIPTKYLVNNGDILVSWAATLDAFIWNNGEGWLNQHIFKAVPNTKVISSDYFFWLIKLAMTHMNNDNKHGIVMQHVTLNVFDNFSVPLPPLSEQKIISSSLQYNCNQVDNLIANVQAQINKLKAYKQSLITEVVTKGLDPSASMKDSGVDWIGDIPYKWAMLRVKNIGETQNGISKGGEFFGSGFPFVSYGDVYKNIVLPNAASGLVQTTESERETYSVKKGDIFFTRTSETIEEVGFSSVCLETIEDATFAGFLIRLRPFNDAIAPEYAKYYFRGEHIRKYLVKEMNLVTRASLGQGLLKAMTVLVPPKDEQLDIARYLDEKCEYIDKLMAIKQEKIAKLEQYKKSLIYEYVTGKKEVM